MKRHYPMGVFFDKPGENSKNGGVKFVTDKLVAIHLRTCAAIVLNIKKMTQILTAGQHTPYKLQRKTSYTKQVWKIPTYRK